MLRLPLTARIPLAVSLLFLVISAARISLALHGLSRQFDSQVSNLGQVYLDGLSAAILPAVRANDGAQMTEVLNRALDTHLGVVDRTLAVVTADHRLLAHVARYPEVEPVPLAILREPSGSLVSLRSEGVWTWRLLDSEQPQLGTLIANLDVSEFLLQRRELSQQQKVDMIAHLIRESGSTAVGVMPDPGSGLGTGAPPPPPPASAT